jgi:asparagine synthase (glutamine-hydrolysing)
MVAAWDGNLFASESSRTSRRILGGYLDRGFPGCLEDWCGDFAISVYDEAEQTLYLARDRIGIRPLYYVVRRDWIAFASQPLALTSLPGVGWEPNPVYMALYAGCHYRTFDNDPHASPYRNVRQLPAAHWLRWSAGVWDIQRYWGLADREDLHGSEKELAQEYRRKLLQSVQRRLHGAKKTGFLLSGGMDSSSVLSAAVHLTGRKQRAYSSTYADEAYDESQEIRTILDSKVSHWSNVRVGADKIFETIRQMVRIHEEPVATATWLSHYEVCRQAAREGVKTLFTGLGGDELNAGEYEHFIFFFADLHRKGKWGVLQREIQSWQNHHNHPVFKKNRAVAMKLLRTRTNPGIPGSVRPDKQLYFRYQLCLNPETFDLDLFFPVLDRIFTDSLKNRCYQDIFRETAPCCLRAQDRHGYAFGLPHHNPFYDTELVEFMFQIPGTMKIRHGVTKHLLRQAMKGILPESTRTRVKKTGWNAPAHLWFSGKNLDLLRDLVRSPAVRNTGIYLESEVDRLISEHENILEDRQPRENHMMFLWQLANVCIWLEEIA